VDEILLEPCYRFHDCRSDASLHEERPMKRPIRIFWLAVPFLFFASLIAAVAAEPVYHELKKGDTLYGIARSYGVPYEAIAAANGISDPSRLRIGDKLIIPDLYRVEEGDTLTAIARVYGTTVDAIRNANRLGSSSVIRVGDILVIPASKFVPGSPSGDRPAQSGGAVPPPETAPAAPAPGRQSPTTTTTGTLVTTTTLRIDPGTTTIPTTTTTLRAASGSTTSTRPDPAPGTTRPLPTTTIRPDSGGTTVTLPPEGPILRTGSKPVDLTLSWPCQGDAFYLEGKLGGIMIRTRPGTTAKAVASGTVISAGPARGFLMVAFILGDSGHYYIYGGNEWLAVDVGDRIKSGDEIGRIGTDPKDGRPVAYFFVYREGQPVDPALAPRG
jgi:murein DD-endopeptidase MepM/ murein hydrolase activator NlpD